MTCTAADALQVFSGRLAQNVAEGSARRLVLAIETAFAPVPGQFLHVAVSGSKEPYLRRPLSIADWDHRRGLLELLVLPVGKGTRTLAALQPGALVDCLGPLGNGFPRCGLGANPLLVGGGIGSAPLIYLARQLVNQGQPPVVFIGASNADRLAGEQSLAALASEMAIATEDGSRGYRGMVTEALVQRCSIRPKPTSILACGPRGMLATIKAIGAAHAIPCYGSLEEHMACGVGACLGCAIPMVAPTDGKKYLRVCADGPVFDLEEVVLS